MTADNKYREIPYNYTSFSDREIICRYFSEETWDALQSLRSERVTGRSAKLLFEIVGDIFVIDRNPYVFDDFLLNAARQKRLRQIHQRKLSIIRGSAVNPLVRRIVDELADLDSRTFARFKTEPARRRRILSGLCAATSEKNISFSPFHKVLHVTDATDWRVEYPSVCCFPGSVAEVRALVRQARSLGLKIIPRGGGTGLTGGAVPVHPDTLVINLEKLNSIGGISMERGDGRDIPVVAVDAGVITENVTDWCDAQGYIFATDPTSAWASTIGGNIAENCGGKKAVMWGTAIDNLFSFDIVDASARLLRVVRRDHPYRRILNDDEVVFDVFSVEGDEVRTERTVSLRGSDIRKKGVGKDITNKALGGLPGVQKEGGDGIIVSACFVLYRPFAVSETICLEFFGSDMGNASRAILAVRERFETDEHSFLTALEHFDDKYVKAIRYRNKSDRTELPKAVLIIDAESNEREALNQACTDLLNLVRPFNCEGFRATDKAGQIRFWADRKNLGAIARHTNAFKLNEDVVIPIEALPEFAEYIESCNLRKTLENQKYAVLQTRELLERFVPEKDDGYFDKKKALVSDRLDRLEHLLDECIRSGADKVPFDAEFRAIDEQLYGYEDVLLALTDVLERASGRRIIIATHMHAGDGNVHVNIPVHSSDYEMMREADEIAGEIMARTEALGGVISGEHGIGLTKLRFLSSDILEAYQRYKDEVDPDHLFNPGKLRADFPHGSIYTPSLKLLKMEAFILEAAELNDLTSSISPCVRCGKCKDVCNTQFPAGNIHFCPRNKILGVSLIVEAVLYEAQTADRLSLRSFKMLKEISSYCTMCHNCRTPCPVHIDFGDVTLYMRNLLSRKKGTHRKLITRMTLFYLKRRQFTANKVFRIALLRGGYGAGRAAGTVLRPFNRLLLRVVPTIGYMLKSRLPHAGARTFRETFSLKSADMYYVFQNPDLKVRSSVFYFPGCGSERMFSGISFAAIALLYRSGIRVLVPPSFMCCGYPLLANGRQDEVESQVYDNSLVLHRVANTGAYLNIQDVLVTCGTCFEMLGRYHFESIFPGSAILDVNEFLMREGLMNAAASHESVAFHEPCHSPTKKYGYAQLIRSLLGASAQPISRCCGEGGTMALSTPHISDALRSRKIANVMDEVGRDVREILTTCPSCVQGLSRMQPMLNVNGVSMIMKVAEKHLGPLWHKDFVHHVRSRGGIEKVLF